jgi:hypothetical protein
MGRYCYLEGSKGHVNALVKYIRIAFLGMIFCGI